VVEAEEAYRMGLLNHLVPCAQLRDKTLDLAAMIASNRRKVVMGVHHRDPDSVQATQATGHLVG
jgi:enoyl-CoA hydratase/carnithine racemase